MKILVLTPNYTYPPVKGYQVMLCRHIEQLAERHSIDLIAFGGVKGQAIESDPIRVLCDKFEIIPLQKWRLLLNLVRGLFSTEPLQVCLYRLKDMLEAVTKQLQITDYDMVIFQLTRMAQFLPEKYQGITILNMVDPLVLNYSRSLVWRPWYIRVVLSCEIARLRRYEIQCAPRFNLVTLIAQRDVLDYQDMLKNAEINQLPYGIDSDFFRPNNKVARRLGMMVITGNMGYAPNVDAVTYFCREVLPLILIQEPNAHLWIVGVHPSSEIRSFGKRNNITVTGYVNDVRDYLWQAMVSICPIRLNVAIPNLKPFYT